MYYFFDESGVMLEKKSFLLGGLIIKDKSLFTWLEAKMDELRHSIGVKKNGAYIIHGKDLSKEKIKFLIDSTLLPLIKNGGIVRISIFSKEVLKNKSSLDFSNDNKEIIKKDLYLELASSFVSDLILMDLYPKIYYDEYFHYHHPKRVLENICFTKKSIKTYLDNCFNKLILREGIIDGEINGLLNKIESIKFDFIDKNRVRHQDLIRFVEGFKMKLQQSEEKLKQEMILQYMKHELQLKIYGEENLRQVFMDRIRSKNRAFYDRFNVQIKDKEVEVNFEKKEKQNAGIEAIDLLCFIVYSNINNLYSDSLSDDVRSLLNLIKVKDESCEQK
jgi:hypothetical protein